MFRADAVSLDRYPDVRKREDEAFGKLVEEIGKAFADQPSTVRLTISIACWAMVHGLATLILEGTLARTVGIAQARQRQVANEVIGTFTTLLIKTADWDKAVNDGERRPLIEHHQQSELPVVQPEGPQGFAKDVR